MNRINMFGSLCMSGISSLIHMALAGALLMTVGVTWLAETPAAATPIQTGSVLWYDGNDIDGDGVSEGAGETVEPVAGTVRWADKSAGLGTTHAEQSVVASKPSLVASDANMNGKTTFDFTCVSCGSGDELIGTGLDLQASNITMFAAVLSRMASHGNNGILNIGNTGGGTDNFNLEHNQGTSRFQLWDESSGLGDPLTTTNVYAKSATGVSHVAFADRLIGSPGRVRLSGDGDALDSATRTLLGHTGTGVLIGHLGAGNEFYNGNMGELLVYNRVLDAPERVIVQNYLSAKWNITLTGSNRYAGDDNANGDYDEDVFGIGREDNTSVTSGTYGSGLILTELNGSLINGEYVLAGHNVLNNGITTNDVPNGDRWERVWYIDETGAVDAELTFDFSDADLTLPTGEGQFKLLYSATDPFNFSELSAPATVVGDQVSFDLTGTMLLDGYYTLAFAAVPEPGTAQLLALGVIGVNFWRSRGRRRN